MAEMTIAQLYAYATDAPDMDSTKRMSLAEASALSETRREAKDKWIARVLIAVKAEVCH